MEAFSAKFSTTPSGETMDWTQKCIGPKMMARTNSITCKIWWKSRDARLSERMKCDVFHFFIFENNARRPSTALVRVELLPKYIASAFLGRFRLYLRLFFGRKALSSLLNSFWNFRYDWCPNGPKKIKNLRKWVQSLCAPLPPFRSKMKENFYHSPIPHVL